MTLIRSCSVFAPRFRRGALGVMVPGGNHRMRPLERQPGGASASGGMVRGVADQPDDVDLLDPAAPPLEQPPVEEPEPVYCYRPARRRVRMPRPVYGVTDWALRMVEYFGKLVLIGVVAFVVLVAVVVFVVSLARKGVDALDDYNTRHNVEQPATTGP